MASMRGRPLKVLKCNLFLGDLQKMIIIDKQTTIPQVYNCPYFTMPFFSFFLFLTFPQNQSFMCSYVQVLVIYTIHSIKLPTQNSHKWTVSTYFSLCYHFVLKKEKLTMELMRSSLNVTPYFVYRLFYIQIYIRNEIPPNLSL